MTKKLTYLLLLLTYLWGHAHPPEELPAMIRFPEAEVLSENTVRIPFELADHLILIKGTVNGLTGNLIVDTGSRNLIINKAHYKDAYVQIRKGTGYGVNGQIDEVMAQRIQHFNFSSFELPKTTADILDLSHIEKSKKKKIIGVVGHSILYEYEVYIDFYLQQITLFKTDHEGNRIDDHFFLDTPDTTIPFLYEGHSIILNTSLNEVPLRMALDTGAEINFLDSDTPEKALKNFRPVQPVQLKGMNKGDSEMLAGKLYGLRLAQPCPIGVMRTLLADLSEMSRAYDASVDGVLGYEFIAMKRILINYKKKALIFVKLPYTSKKS